MSENPPSDPRIDAIVTRLESASKELFVVCEKYQLTPSDIDVIIKSWHR